MTEKNYNPNQKEKKAMKKVAAAEKVKKEIVKDIEGQGKNKENIVPEAVAKKEEQIAENIEKSTEQTTENKAETNGAEEKKPVPVVKTKPKHKKDEAVINSYGLAISTKKAAGVCKFIKGMKIEDAIEKLEKVARGKKAVPLKGELPHRKGRIMSGGFPQKTAKEFIVVLKGLIGNANVNDIDEPIIVEAIANLASRPYSKFGRVRRKRTHLRIVAREKKMIKKKKSKSAKKGGKK